MGKGSEHTFLQRRHTMANEHMKRCSTSLVMEEVQFKTMRYHFIATRKALIKCQIITSVSENVEKQKRLYTAGGNIKWYSHFGRQFGGILQN